MMLNLVVAFAAGVLGFFSPCVAPLIPGYVSFVSGVSLWEMQMAERRQHLGRVFLASIVFILGFSVVFTSLGASASFIGAFVISNRVLLTLVGGVIDMLLALVVLGVIKIPSLARERRVHVVRWPGGTLGAFPIGVAFGVGMDAVRRAGAGCDPRAGGDHGARRGRGHSPLRV